MAANQTSETTRRGAGSVGKAVLRSWPTMPETPTSQGRCVSRPMPTGAGFPEPKAMRPSRFGLPLSSSRLTSGVLLVVSGSLNAPCKVNRESLPTGTKRSTRIWPLMLLPIGAPSMAKGRTVGTPGATTSNCRPAANLQRSLNNSPYDCVSRNPLLSEKRLLLSKNTADILPPVWNSPISGPVKATPSCEFRALISMVCWENPPANLRNQKDRIAGRLGTRCVVNGVQLGGAEDSDCEAFRGHHFAALGLDARRFRRRRRQLDRRRGGRLAWRGAELLNQRVDAPGPLLRGGLGLGLLGLQCLELLAHLPERLGRGWARVRRCGLRGLGAHSGRQERAREQDRCQDATERSAGYAIGWALLMLNP